MTIERYDNNGKPLSPLEGARKCPGCAKSPTATGGPDNWTIECQRHGHMAMGETLMQAVQFWNRYIAGITFDALANAVQSRDRSKLTSICAYCRNNTRSLERYGKDETVIECVECHLVKYCKAA